MLKILLAGILVLGLVGCASVKEFYNSPHPGMIAIDGAEIQLFYSNPDTQFYRVPNSDLPLSGIEVPRIYEKRGSEPTVTGGIGLMGTWRF